MKELMFALAFIAAAVSMTGCVETTRRIVEGETAEATADLNEDDIRTIVSQVVQDIDRNTIRFVPTDAQGNPVPGRRRVVNVKNIKIDTSDRGMNASYLAETVAQCLKEELMNSGKFMIYNERIGAAGTINPDFVLDATLKQRDVRRDNGNIYRENSLNIQLTDVHPGSQTYGLEFWQKRVSLRRGVDKTNVMN